MSHGGWISTSENVSAKEGHVHARGCGCASHFVAELVFTLTEKKKKNHSKNHTDNCRWLLSSVKYCYITGHGMGVCLWGTVFSFLCSFCILVIPSEGGGTVQTVTQSNFDVRWDCWGLHLQTVVKGSVTLHAILTVVSREAHINRSCWKASPLSVFVLQPFPTQGNGCGTRRHRNQPFYLFPS